MGGRSKALRGRGVRRSCWFLQASAAARLRFLNGRAPDSRAKWSYYHKPQNSELHPAAISVRFIMFKVVRLLVNLTRLSKRLALDESKQMAEGYRIEFSNIGPERYITYFEKER